jgi:serine/threonine protein kinase
MQYIRFKSSIGTKVPLEDIRYIFYQITEALYELRTKTGLSHMDLKPQNILITPEGRVKLIDFCHARPADIQFYGEYGTKDYTSPLAPNCQLEYPHLRDAYALGIVLFMLTFLREPFNTHDAI